MDLAQLAHRVQQAEFLNFLVCGEQIALHPVGKKLQGALPFFACGHALTLQLQALGDPHRQSLALHGFDLQGDAKIVQRAKPGAFFGGRVQARQHKQGQGVGVALRGLRQLLDRRAAFFAGFARRDAHFHDLPVGKQAQRAAAGQHLAPVKVRA